MKNLSHKLFSNYQNNKIDNLAKIIGGAEQSTKYDNGDHCGNDTINTETTDGIAIYLNGATVATTCDFVDLTKVEIVSQQPK